MRSTLLGPPRRLPSRGPWCAGRSVNMSGAESAACSILRWPRRRAAERHGGPLHDVIATIVAQGDRQQHAGNPLLMWLAFGAVAVGLLGSTRAPFKSPHLSPDSIERWFYWTGCAVGCVLLFISQLPNWTRSIFGATAVGAALIAIAFLRSNHLKVGRGSMRRLTSSADRTARPRSATTNLAERQHLRGPVALSGTSPDPPTA